MLVILVNKVVDTKIIIGKRGGSQVLGVADPKKDCRAIYTQHKFCVLCCCATKMVCCVSKFMPYGQLLIVRPNFVSYDADFVLCVNRLLHNCDDSFVSCCLCCLFAQPRFRFRFFQSRSTGKKLLRIFGSTWSWSGKHLCRQFFFWGGGGSATPCAFPPPQPSIFSNYSFWSTTLLTGMTGISLHIQWPLTSPYVGSY
jgi:hypothetical protein